MSIPLAPPVNNMLTYASFFSQTEALICYCLTWFVACKCSFWPLDHSACD
jgi:hypothetical protein